MSLKAREELGIADEQRRMRYEPIFSDNLVVGSTHRRVLSDGIRESICLCALTTAGKAKRILILCGLSHADELRQRFEKLGHQVTLDSL